jgi:hypothetical protein
MIQKAFCAKYDWRMHICAGARDDLQQSPLQYVTSMPHASQLMLRHVCHREATSGKRAARGPPKVRLRPATAFEHPLD